jgi:hypothetical protein
VYKKSPSPEVAGKELDASDVAVQTLGGGELAYGAQSGSAHAQGHAVGSLSQKLAGHHGDDGRQTAESQKGTAGQLHDKPPELSSILRPGGSLTRLGCLLGLRQ